ncbi:MAG: ATP:cob(I)alamin adenosyltransferase [Gammaproteobacteria bacterium RIFCSPHIGHO2_12_FULL_38_14]|nr:MAG: ATP:cob(I)alamin adenosyltransferase [Gammaproteobacteria bacterium RIFCSPHIGHO2_12_FULL_38_14]
MPYRLTKIYTRKGDKGHTHLAGKERPKDDALVEAVGTIDELNAHIGFVISLSISNQDIKNKLTEIQHALFDIGGELHAPSYVKITAEKITDLEMTIDHWNNQLPPLEEFILPRGNSCVAACHIARTVCRRAERTLVKLHRETPLNNPELLRYINRLSDVLFVFARILAAKHHDEEILWKHE